MGITYFPTKNNNGVRDMSQTPTLGAYLYQDWHAPAEPAAKAAMTPVNLGAMIPIRSISAPPRQAMPDYMLTSRVTGWRQMSPSSYAPPVSSQSSPTPTVTAPAPLPPTSIYVSSGGGTASPNFQNVQSTAGQVAGTPVPQGFPIDSIFMNPANGSQWAYSSGQGKWINVGTPYNLAAPSAQSYDSRITSSAAVPAAALSTAMQPASTGYSTAAAPSVSLSDQVASWLGGSTAIGSYAVPNALLAGGFAVAVAFLMGGGKKR